MVARDLTSGKVTSPVPRKDRGDGVLVADEPHIGLTVNDGPKPRTYQTGVVRGGTTNPQQGKSGEVEHIELAEGEADAGHGPSFTGATTKSSAKSSSGDEA